jgi:hypothetical protein
MLSKVSFPDPTLRAFPFGEVEGERARRLQSPHCSEARRSFQNRKVERPGGRNESEAEGFRQRNFSSFLKVPSRKEKNF